MRRLLSAILLLAALLAACGGGGSAGGTGRDLNLELDGAPAARHAGVYLAVSRGYDRALGVTLRIGREPAEIRLVPLAQLDPKRRVAVMAVLPGELYLAVDRFLLDERRDDVAAAVEALQRGYEETIADPESAVAALVEAEKLDRARLLGELDELAPRFRAGGRDFGVLDTGRLPEGAYDASLALPRER